MHLRVKIIGSGYQQGTETVSYIPMACGLITI